MTETGRYGRQTTGMDLIELARTIQADRERAIETERRRRQYLSTTAERVATSTAARPISSPQRPASSGALSR